MELNHNYVETDLEKIRHIAKRKENENLEFRAFLKMQDGDKVDKIVHQLNEEITAQIDCTECGNCCVELRPTLTAKEIDVLARIDILPKEEFVELHTEKVEFEEDKCLKAIPCKYLKDKKCTIYIDRPHNCKSYPHTHKTEFTSRTMSIIMNYEVCPIIYNVIEDLKFKLKFGVEDFWES